MQIRRYAGVLALRRLPYRPISEPIGAHLAGRAEPRAHWAHGGLSCEPVVVPPE